jgi:hypothetical protein
MGAVTNEAVKKRLGMHPTSCVARIPSASPTALMLRNDDYWNCRSRKSRRGQNSVGTADEIQTISKRTYG